MGAPYSQGLAAPDALPGLEPVGLDLDGAGFRPPEGTRTTGAARRTVVVWAGRVSLLGMRLMILRALAEGLGQ